MIDSVTIIVSVIIAGLIGLSIGSFITVLVRRLPLGEKLVLTRSKCPTCSHVLSIKDLIPVASWLMLHGKCRYCSQPISPLYPFLELGTAAIFMIITIISGFTLSTLLTFALLAVVIPLIIIDIKHFILPDQLMIALAIIIMLKVGFYPDKLVLAFVSSLLCVALAMILKVSVSAWVGKDALGYGDVKLFAIVGWYLQASPALITIFMFTAGIFGLIFALIWSWVFKKDVFPFGPALLLSLLLIFLYPYYLEKMVSSLTRYIL